MKILYTFFNFNGFTGSELYFYELAREMRLFGHEVTISSHCGGDIKKAAESHGIKCVSFEDIKNFKEFDIIHVSHKPVIYGLSHHKRNLPPVIVTCHSEILEMEVGVKDFDFVDHFIGVRPTIYDMLPFGKRSLVYNPVNTDVFNEKLIINNEELTILPKTANIYFPGTINYLRIKPIEDLKKTGYSVITKGESEFLDISTDFASSFSDDYLYKRCTSSAGILKGRTYIESFLCGKDHLNYTVNKKGNILGKELLKAEGDYLDFGVPVHKSEFDSKVVAKKIEYIYKELI